MDALTSLVCTAIDGVTHIASPVLGHTCAWGSGRAHMKVRREDEEEERVRALKK